MIVPDAPIPAAYHKLLTESSSLIEHHAPHIVVHLGLAADRDYFAIEQSALKEGYHDIPDIERKVITRAENKKLFGKAPASLNTSLDLGSAVPAWQAACTSFTMPSTGNSKPKGKVTGKLRQEKKKIDVRLSDDVGTYVCGLIYFSSMFEMQKKRGSQNVVFLHVPPLNDDGEVSVGIQVVTEAIIALVDVWEEKH